MTDEQKPEPIGVELKIGMSIEKVNSLEDLIERIKQNLPESLEGITKPGVLKDWELYGHNYFLTLKNIKKALSAEYKVKEKEEWLDVYIFEYKEKEQVIKDFGSLSYKQENITEKKEGNLRILAQDKYLILICNYSRESNDAAEMLFKNCWNEFKMKKVRAVYILEQ